SQRLSKEAHVGQKLEARSADVEEAAENMDVARLDAMLVGAVKEAADATVVLEITRMKTCLPMLRRWRGCWSREGTSSARLMVRIRSKCRS
ncbi:MAG: hypothetical protein ACKPKO_38135, partial [Candidatus Fonsibacter sp.]